MPPTVFSINPGVTINPGVVLNGFASGGGGDITITFNEFVYPTGIATIYNFEDSTPVSISGTGVTIYNPTKSGVFMVGLTTPNLAFIAANLPDSMPGALGEIWTATWAAGSTYTSTPIAIYYVGTGGGFGGNPAIVFWILDPADGTYNTGATGTFNWPMTLTAGTTPTSFQE